MSSGFDDSAPIQAPPPERVNIYTFTYKDPVYTAPIWFAACIGIAIWAGIATRRRRHVPIITDLFGWKFWTTIALVLVTNGWGIISLAIGALNGHADIVRLIFGNLIYPALIFLLITIYTLLSCLNHMTGSTSKLNTTHGSPRALFLHRACLAFMGLLYIIILCVQIAYTFKGPAADHWSRSLAPALGLTIVWDLLYLFVTIEILIHAVTLCKTWARDGSPGGKAISTLMMTLIAVPGIALAVMQLISDAILVVPYSPDSFDSSALQENAVGVFITTSILYGLVFVFSLSGIVAIAQRIAKTSNNTGLYGTRTGPSTGYDRMDPNEAQGA